MAGKMQGLGSVQKSTWRDQYCCHGYIGHREPGRQRAHGEYECHHTAAGRRCGALTVLAATRSERAQWPSPGG